MSNDDKPRSKWFVFGDRHPHWWALCSFPILVFSIVVVIPISVLFELVTDIPRIFSNWWQDVRGSWKSAFRDGGKYCSEFIKLWAYRARGFTTEQIKRAEEAKYFRHRGLEYDEEKGAWVTKKQED